MKKPKQAANAQGKPAGQELPREEALNLITLFNAGRLAELESRARLFCERYPASGFVWKVLGTALLVQGKDAISVLQKAVALMPQDAESHSNLGNALKTQGRVQDAAQAYRQAIALNPALPLPPFNLGIALCDLGQHAEAVASFQQALRLQPQMAEAHFNLGIALRALARLDDAAASYRQALALKPDYADAHINLGIVLKELGLFEQAAHSFERAVAIKPDMAEAHNNLGNILKDLGRLDEALANFRQALLLRPGFTEAFSNLLFALNYQTGQTADHLLNEARRYGELVAKPAQATPPLACTPRGAQQPLRVGFVSGDLGQHPVGYFLEGVLTALAAGAGQRVQLFAYTSNADVDPMTQRLQALFQGPGQGGWRSIAGVPDARALETIRADGIDILIDLSGHTGYNRLPLFALRPAPVQASWLGYFATTGVAAIDYVLADPWTLPEAHEAQFTEHIWRLPHTRLCFTPPDVDVPVAPLPALSQGHVTFGCFNNLTKMNDEVVALWARMLQAVPGSRLLLKAKQLNEDTVQRGVTTRFGAHGIGPERLVLQGRSPRHAYLATYGQVDIGLDPFPFTGGTTSAESLWMGVPVLTLAGDRLVSRQGVGLLMNAGLPDWVAQDADDYVARAQAHAADLPRLAALRKGLREQVRASPLFDAARFAQDFEAALLGMYRDGPR